MARPLGRRPAEPRRTASLDPMSPSTGDEDTGRRRAAVEREMRRIREDDRDADPDLVDTVGEEQRREREALEDDAGDDDER
jgi:hypothetical protein